MNDTRKLAWLSLSIYTPQLNFESNALPTIVVVEGISRQCKGHIISSELN